MERGLGLYPKPKVIGCALRVFPIDALESVFRWVHAHGPEIPASVELNVVIRDKAPGVGGPGVEMFAPVFEDSHEAALRALDFLNEAPLESRTGWHVPFAPTPLGVMWRIVMSHSPKGRR